MIQSKAMEEFLFTEGLSMGEFKEYMRARGTDVKVAGEQRQQKVEHFDKKTVPASVGSNGQGGDGTKKESKKLNTGHSGFSNDLKEVILQSVVLLAVLNPITMRWIRKSKAFGIADENEHITTMGSIKMAFGLIFIFIVVKLLVTFDCV